MTDMRATYPGPFCGSGLQGIRTPPAGCSTAGCSAYCRLIVGIRSHCLDGKLMLSFQRLDSA
jgi:hypothetical protein